VAARPGYEEGAVSYEIDVSSVTAVLLADGWHRVKGRSFGIEPYGYVAIPNGNGKADDAKAKEAKDGKEVKDAKNAKSAKKKAARVEPVADKGLAPVMGARWTKPNGEVIACPVGSVLALRHALAAKS
jgi:hypothetical protein